MDKLSLIQLELKLASHYSSVYRNRVQMISKPQFIDMCIKVSLMKCYKAGFKFRSTYMDYEVINVVNVLDKRIFKRDEIKIGVFNPLKLVGSLSYLVEQGYLNKFPKNGNYYVTEKYDDFWKTFEKEYIKAIRGYWRINKMGNAKKKLRATEKRDGTQN